MSATINITTGTGTATVTLSTGARGPAGEAGADGSANITQAAITTAITDDAQFRTDIGLGDAATKTVSTGGNGVGDSGKVAVFSATGALQISDTLAITAAGSNNLVSIVCQGLTASDRQLLIPDADGTIALEEQTQATLISGTNIKSINGNSLLGSGNLTVSSDLTSGPVTSSAGVSAIADSALSIAKTNGLQTALDAKFSGPLRVACVGTSITFQGSLLDTTLSPRIHDLTNGYAGWLEHLTNHKVRLVRRTGLFESYTDKTFGYSGFGLTGLTNGSGGVYPLDNAIAAGAEVLVLEGGTNDVSGGDSSATVITKITAYWTKAVNSGARVIALNIPPMGSGIINSTKRDVITTVNAALPALATSLGVTLIDVYATATIDGSGYATTESAFDGIHPTPAFAHRMAALIAVPLNTWAAKRPAEMMVPNAQGSLTNAGSFVTGTKYVIADPGNTSFPGAGGNNVRGVEFTATGAGTGTGNAYVANPVWLTVQPNPSQTGTKPAYWTTTGFTGTYTAVTDADGTLWQRVRMVQSGSANGLMHVYQSITSGFTAGDKVRFSCRLRAVSGGTTDFTEIQMSASNIASATTTFRAISGGANLGTGNYNAITGLFVSPVFVVPASTTSMILKLEIYGNDVEFDIRDFGIFKVVENH